VTVAEEVVVVLVVATAVTRVGAGWPASAAEGSELVVGLDAVVVGLDDRAVCVAVAPAAEWAAAAAVPGQRRL